MLFGWSYTRFNSKTWYCHQSQSPVFHDYLQAADNPFAPVGEISLKDTLMCMGGQGGNSIHNLPHIADFRLKCCIDE